MEELLGSTFLRQKHDKCGLEALEKAKLIGIYFASYWCPPCRSFTVKLADFYNDVNSIDLKIEIVFVSFDKGKADFDTFRDTMPWISLELNEARAKELSAKFGCKGIPHLVILQQDGSILNPNGRADVQNKGGNAYDEWVTKL